MDENIKRERAKNYEEFKKKQTQKKAELAARMKAAKALERKVAAIERQALREVEIERQALREAEAAALRKKEARLANERQEVQMLEPEDIPARLFFAVFLQAGGACVVVCCVIAACATDSLTVVVPGITERVFNLQLAHQNLIGFMSGALLCIYGNLLTR